MSNIEKFILDVDSEVIVALQSGILPDPSRSLQSLKRLSRQYPELKIDPKKEIKIERYARIALNARNN